MFQYQTQVIKAGMVPSTQVLRHLSFPFRSQSINNLHIISPSIFNTSRLKVFFFHTHRGLMFNALKYATNRSHTIPTGHVLVCNQSVLLNMFLCVFVCVYANTHVCTVVFSFTFKGGPESFSKPTKARSMAKFPICAFILMMVVYLVVCLCICVTV